MNMAKIQLTPDQLEEYELNGHLIVHEVFSKQEISEVLERIEGLLDGRYDSTGMIAGISSNRSEDDPGRLIKQVMPLKWPIPDPVLLKFSEHPILKSLCCQLMKSSSAQVFQQQALLKEPGYPNGTPWHQDDYYWKLAGPAVTAWFPLEPLSKENGTMSVFLGSHKGEIFDHARAQGGSDFHQLQTNLDESTAVPIVIPVGSVSFHHKALIHGAFANLGNARRVALAQHYFDDEHPIDGPRIQKSKNES
jgi:ectoine hydroxylase-related dioxygenase (phytanoyl-CoA dioxygenase family)